MGVAIVLMSEMGFPRFMLVKMLMLLFTIGAATTANNPASDCHYCGEVEIPFPFGTQPNCTLNEDFLVTCDHNYDRPRPFLGHLDITNISINGHLQIPFYVSKTCYGDTDQANEPWLTLNSNIFTVSDAQNKFTVIGCDSYGYIQGQIGKKNYKAACTSSCESIEDVTNGSCLGIGCCQIDLPKGLKNINITAYSFDEREYVRAFNPCTYAFVAEDTKFNFSSDYLKNYSDEATMMLDWAITGKGKCIVGEGNNTSSAPACKENTECYNVRSNPDGYICKCKAGYDGNPYLSNGCKDVNECESNSHECDENSICNNTLGNYTCICRKGFKGDGRVRGGCVPNQLPIIKIVLCVGISFVILLMGGSWLYFLFKKRKLVKRKEKFFEQNGGLILQRKLSQRSGSSDAAKIFTEEELKKATGNFDKTRIIGRGGYGVVYKGYLTDNKPVAIKKSKGVDPCQIEQFTNEVTILSQINHKNVVKLLGCCLVTEVPLLVYEFISNGTLFDHIHKTVKVSILSWEIRLRIATETAALLSYLHSGAHIPIIHRDVKSSNILLDDNFTAKVSDFGISKLNPMDKTQLSTMVQGTMGYLDPEYFRTSQLTEKSDVYSFGVVLLELLTGKKVLSFDRPENERSLVAHFLFALRDGCLFRIVEDDVASDKNKEQIKEVAKLALKCIKVKWEERPTMKEVSMELEGLIAMHKQYLQDTVELNPEEIESELSAQTFKSYTSFDGSSTSTTAVGLQGYDSTKDSVQQMTLDNGR